MQKVLSDHLINILACPHCLNNLIDTEKGFQCSSCNQEYVYDNGQVDLRLQKAKKVAVEFDLGTELLPDKGFDFVVLPKKPSPEVDYSKIKVPWHLTQELMSYFPKAKGPGSMMLDLGCGAVIHKEVAEYAGFEYVGIDYGGPKTPILGDGHALPFKDNSFDFILSIAVLEHIQNPFVMMKEASRVLKPGGKLIGTVAFLEPFHQNSFYHHTHLGTYNTLKSSGFEVEKVAPSAGWSVLIAQSRMLFNKLPRPLSKLIVTPVYLLHRLWWKSASLVSKKAKEAYRVLITTGSFSFIASKPG